MAKTSLHTHAAVARLPGVSLGLLVCFGHGNSRGVLVAASLCCCSGQPQIVYHRDLTVEPVLKL